MAGQRWAVRGAAAVVLALGASGLGCYSQATYPPREGQLVNLPTPNTPPAPGLMTDALRHVLLREDVPLEAREDFAVNLPEGVGRVTYMDVVRELGPAAHPLMPETEGLPTYHVGELWIRGNRARVDVVRPRGDGQTQGVTVWFESRLGPWRVTRTREWNPGTVRTPEPYYLPDRTTTGGGDDGDGDA